MRPQAHFPTRAQSAPFAKGARHLVNRVFQAMVAKRFFVRCRSAVQPAHPAVPGVAQHLAVPAAAHRAAGDAPCPVRAAALPVATLPSADRKSTRLNSSHVAISYAVFCLKKKSETH